MNAFRAAFGSSGDVRSFFAPGRVNLIGEYTDFNGGHVLPCALTIGTYAAARQRQDRRLRLISVNFPGTGVIETDLDHLALAPAHDWANYPKGVLHTLREAGHGIETGLDIAFGGNIPNGAGLSSSASIEVLTATVLNALFGLGIGLPEQALLAQRAENSYIGVNCGIMDQFAVAMGQADHALLLNTDTLHYEQVPLILGGHCIVIANTNRRRGLADSKYNVRFAECREALADLQTVTAIRSLGDLTEAAFEAAAHAVRSPEARKRARHAVYENQRTLAAADILKSGNLSGFGALMNVSHRSLRDDFQVSCTELDVLVELAQNHPGVLGARLTGAGFGGCTVNLVAQAEAEAFISRVGAAYRERIGYDADFYVVRAGDGAREL